MRAHLKGLVRWVVELGSFVWLQGVQSSSFYPHKPIFLAEIERKFARPAPGGAGKDHRGMVRM